jgi:hypothetical protein
LTRRHDRWPSPRALSAKTLKPQGRSMRAYFLSLWKRSKRRPLVASFAILPFKGVVQRFTRGQKQIVAPTLVKVPCLRSLTNPLSAHWSASGGIVRQTGSGRSSIEAMAFGSWSSVSLASALHPGYVLVGLSAFTSSAPAGFQLGSAIFAHPSVMAASNA